MFEVNQTAGMIAVLLVSMFGLAIVIFFVARYLYFPRSSREWGLILTSPEGRTKLRKRKRRLDAIRSRRPGAILPGIPTSMRDFALEPLIRRGQFKAARSYIMEQIRRHRDSPESNGRMRIYVQYLELIEGSY